MKIGFGDVVRLADVGTKDCLVIDIDKAGALITIAWRDHRGRVQEMEEMPASHYRIVKKNIPQVRP